MVFQESRLFPWFNVEQDIDFGIPKSVGAADVLLELGEDFAVGEMGDVNFAERDAEVLGNVLRKLRVGRAGVNANVFCLFHFLKNPFCLNRKRTGKEETGKRRCHRSRSIPFRSVQMRRATFR